MFWDAVRMELELSLKLSTQVQCQNTHTARQAIQRHSSKAFYITVNAGAFFQPNLGFRSILIMGLWNESISGISVTLQIMGPLFRIRHASQMLVAKKTVLLLTINYHINKLI